MLRTWLDITDNGDDALPLPPAVAADLPFRGIKEVVPHGRVTRLPGVGALRRNKPKPAGVGRLGSRARWHILRRQLARFAVTEARRDAGVEMTQQPSASTGFEEDHPA